jgi:hypothetical protein
MSGWTTKKEKRNTLQRVTAPFLEPTYGETLATNFLSDTISNLSQKLTPSTTFGNKLILARPPPTLPRRYCRVEDYETRSRSCKSASFSDLSVRKNCAASR